LNEHQLIIIDENTEEKKVKAFEVFKSAFEKLYMCKSFEDDKIFTTLNVDNSLKENFVHINKIIIDELNSLKISVIMLNLFEWKSKKRKLKIWKRKIYNNKQRSIH
jgi:hypothetical protein